MRNITQSEAMIGTLRAPTPERQQIQKQLQDAENKYFELGTAEWKQVHELAQTMERERAAYGNARRMSSSSVKLQKKMDYLMAVDQHEAAQGQYNTGETPEQVQIRVSQITPLENQLSQLDQAVEQDITKIREDMRTAWTEYSEWADAVHDAAWKVIEPIQKQYNEEVGLVIDQSKRDGFID